MNYKMNENNIPEKKLSDSYLDGFCSPEFASGCQFEDREDEAFLPNEE